MGNAMPREKKDIKEPAKYDYRIEIKKSGNGKWQAEKVFPEPRKVITDFESQALALNAMEEVADDKAKEGEDVIDIVLCDDAGRPQIRYRYKREIIKHIRVLSG